MQNRNTTCKKKNEQLHSVVNFLIMWLLSVLSHVSCFAIPRTAAHQAPLSFTVCQSLLKLMSIESVMP